MKHSFFVLTVLFLSNSLFAQKEICINTDVGNLILLRPNIGVEYRFGKNALTILTQYQTNKWFVTEMPTLLKSKGVRVDLSYKYFTFKKYPRAYHETLVRVQESLTNNINFFKEYPLKHSEKSIEVGQKIGVQSRKQKFFYTDFSLGMGGKLKFIQQEDLFNIDPNYQSFLDNRNQKPFFQLVPYLQLRLGHSFKL